MDALYVGSVERAIGQLRAAINTLLMKEMPLPALILIYSMIDIVAWLNRPAAKEQSDRRDFIAWLNEFMLPAVGLAVTAEDLYAARCAIVHSHSFESSMSRGGRARKLFYTYGRADPGLLEYVVSHQPATEVGVKIETLLEAFDQAFAKFKEALDSDQVRSKLVNERALLKFFAFVPTPTTANCDPC